MDNFQTRKMATNLVKHENAVDALRRAENYLLLAVKNRESNDVLELHCDAVRKADADVALTLYSRMLVLANTEIAK